jgi:hypothetical protein
MKESTTAPPLETGADQEIRMDPAFVPTAAAAAVGALATVGTVPLTPVEEAPVAVASEPAAYEWTVTS